MVKYDILIKVIENYVSKCLTLSEIREKLKNFTQEEKLVELSSLLNKGEFKYYNDMLEFMRSYENYDEDEHIDYTNKVYKEYQKECEKELFRFERRIIEGYSIQQKPKRNVNIDDFKIDNQEFDIIGELEKKQIKSQSNIEFTEKQISSMLSYFGLDSFNLNSKLYGGKTWNTSSETFKKNVTKKLNEIDKNLHEAINMTNGLEQDTILFRGAKFDVSKVVGDSITFKGYTSTSFKRSTAEMYYDFDTITPSLNYTYQILLPKGTKGICSNDKSQTDLNSVADNNEYLLDKNMKFDIVDIDYENQVVTIIKSER